MSKEKFSIKDNVTIKIISKKKDQDYIDKKINNSLQKKEQFIKE